MDDPNYALGPIVPNRRRRPRVRRQTRTPIVTATLLLLALPLAPPAEAQTGSISGTVTEEISGDPLSGTTVRVYDDVGDVVGFTTTDGAGDYEVTGLTAGGPYFVRTVAPSSHLDELYDGLPCTPDCDVTGGTQVFVTAGATTAGIDFTLDLAGAISGTITATATSDPLSGAGVFVFDSLGQYVEFASTDAAGSYTAEGLAPGNHFLRTSNTQAYLNELYDDLPCAGCEICGNLCDPTTGTPVPVTAGATTSGVDFALDAGGRISGSVTATGTGTPITSGQVALYDVFGNFFDLLSIPGGTFSTGAGLPAGTYTARTFVYEPYFDELYDDIPCAACDVTAGTPIPSVAGSTTSGIDFVLDPSGSISGTIVDADTLAGIDDAWVRVYDDLGAFVKQAHANASGSYTASRLEPGLYTLHTVNSVHFFDELYDDLPCEPGCDVTAGTGVLVTATQTTSGIDFELAPGGRIAGIVTDAGTSDPVAGARVDLFDDLGNLVVGQEVDYSGGPDTGTFVSPVLEPGTYYARTTNSQGYLDELYDDLPCTPSCDVTTGTPLTVVAGTTTSGVDFALTVGGRISGTVTDPTGRGLPGVSVWVHDSAGTFVTGDVTGATGTFTSERGLLAGSYYVLTTLSVEHLDELYDDLPCPFSAGGCVITTGTPVAVSLGTTTTGIDFVLEVVGGVFADRFEAGNTSAWSRTVGGAP